MGLAQWSISNTDHPYSPSQSTFPSIRPLAGIEVGQQAAVFIPLCQRKEGEGSKALPACPNSIPTILTLDCASGPLHMPLTPQPGIFFPQLLSLYEL